MRKKKLVLIFLAISYLFIFFVINSQAFTLPAVLNKNYVDYNKNWKDDDNMCWAYAVSNAIEFAIGLDGKKIFTILKSQYGNTPQVPFFVLRDFFFEYLISPDKKDKALPFFDADARNELMESLIIGSLIKRQVVIIGVTFDSDAKTYPTKSTKGTNTPISKEAKRIIKELKKGWRHSLTVYGFEIGNDDETYIHYVDSDDGKRKMKMGRLYQEDNKIYLQESEPFENIFIDGYIEDITTLKTVKH